MHDLDALAIYRHIDALRDPGYKALFSGKVLLGGLGIGLLALGLTGSSTYYLEPLFNGGSPWHGLALSVLMLGTLFFGTGKLSEKLLFRKERRMLEALWLSRR